MASEYKNIPVPGYTSPTATTDDKELLYSTKGGWTQVGVTVAGGQGVLTRGTVLAQKTSDKLYYKYDNNQSDGRGVARGILRKTIDTGASGAASQQGLMVIAGILKNSLISGSDASAVSDLGARVDTVVGTFRL
jgi:hypothetical protein